MPIKLVILQRILFREISYVLQHGVVCSGASGAPLSSRGADVITNDDVIIYKRRVHQHGVVCSGASGAPLSPRGLTSSQMMTQ